MTVRIKTEEDKKISVLKHLPFVWLEGFGKKRKEMEGKKINSFVWLGGTAVKKRKMKEINSSMAHHILSSQIERKMREYLR